MRYGAYNGPGAVAVGADLWRDGPATREAPRGPVTPDATATLPAMAPAGAPTQPSGGLTLGLSTVNWLILMALLCTFLLAKTLPAADTALTDGHSPAATTQADRADRR